MNEPEKATGKIEETKEEEEVAFESSTAIIADIGKAEDVDEETVVIEESVITPTSKSPRRKSTKRKKPSGVSAKKSEVKPVDEAKAEPAEVAPLASMSVAGDRIKVQSLWPARLIIRGAPSGEEYVWANAGAIEAVNPADVGFLMSKNRGKVPSDGRGCCGGDGTRIYLALV